MGENNKRIAKGDRVQAHPATDAWMFGDRFGTVQLVGRKRIHVLMDTSGRVRTFRPCDLVDEWGAEL